MLLTETELEKLLVRLVQCLRIDVLNDEKALVISTRRQRSGRDTATLAPTPPPRSAECRETSGGEAEERQLRRRPRSCPSTMPNANALGRAAATSTLRDNSDRSTVAQHESDTAMQARLSSWLNRGTARFGLRHHGAFYLAHASYSLHPAALTVRSVDLASRANTTAQAVYTSVQVDALVRQLDAHELIRDAFLLREIRRLLP